MITQHVDGDNKERPRKAEITEEEAQELATTREKWREAVSFMRCRVEY